ncbi:MAG: antibiotic biosynthesis monooxygenase [Proteobacteria bacterium]|nr:antibiotic biosynthesis monooxygenase [Pseudomonadota bacterium]
MAETMILTIPVKPEKRDEFAQMMGGVLPDTRAYEGCLGVDLWLPEDNDSNVLFFERWATRANQEAYFAWRIETGLMDALAPFLAGEPVVTWMDVKHSF